ncbi:MAG: phosphatase PAP2 family protein [Pseudomonadota bacterium]
MLRASMVGLAFLVALLTWQVLAKGILTSVDDHLETRIAGHIGAGVRSVAHVVSLAGGPAVMGGLACGALVLAALLREWRALFAFLIAVVGSILTIYTLRVSVGRPRPESYGDLSSAGSSFPSASTALATTVVVAFALVLLPRLAPAASRGGLSLLFWLFPVSVAASRLLLDAHFLTDVLAGLCIGVFWALAGRLFLARGP